MNLLLMKGQIKIAVEGVKLLKSKRDALMKEFFAVMDTVLGSRDELTSLCQEAMNVLNMAKASDGEFYLESAALGAHRTLDLHIEDKHVWGIPIPEIEQKDLVRAFNARGYSPTTVSTRVDETAEAFEKILNQALKIASQETRLKRLGERPRADPHPPAEARGHLHRPDPRGALPRGHLPAEAPEGKQAEKGRRSPLTRLSFRTTA
jgi:V/A-type H+-transporting ATPase subunit D